VVVGLKTIFSNDKALVIVSSDHGGQRVNVNCQGRKKESFKSLFDLKGM